MNPYYEDGPVTLHHGDCIQVLRADELGYDFELGYGATRLLPDASVDAVVTDPPYALEFMGKGWDRFTPAEFEAWCTEWATECARVLKPGGHLLAFGGSRTWHRLQAGIEDAGFEIRDSIAWLYGSGFPKSLDVSAAIDKLDASSAERTARAREFQSWLREHMTPKRVNELTGTDMGYHLTTHPTQPSVATADLFDLLRPELPEVPERIEQLVAERTVESENFAAREVTGKHRAGTARGAAGFTVAGEGKERRDLAFTDEARAWEGWGTTLKPAFEPIVVARKPLVGTVAGNVLAYGTGALNIDATRIPTTDALGGGTVSSRGDGWDRPWKADAGAVEAAKARSAESVAKAESMGRWPTNVVLDESQAAELDRQSGVLTSGKMQPTHTMADRKVFGQNAAGGYTTMETYGDSGGASRFFPTFRYEAKAPSAERPEQGGVQHPTVKPLALMQWLVRLVTPPAGVVLEPFAGSGTTVEACLREGFGCVAIEREADYLPLIMQRIQKPHEVSLFDDFGGDAA